LASLDMTAGEAFINNVVLQLGSVAGVMAIHLLLILLVTWISPAVGNSKALAFPKFEVAWLLATFEGTLMASVMVVALDESEEGDLNIPQSVLVALAVVVFVAFALLLAYLAYKVHLSIRMLRTQGTLTFDSLKPSKPVVALYKEFKAEALERRRARESMGQGQAVTVTETGLEPQEAIDELVMLEEVEPRSVLVHVEEEPPSLIEDFMAAETSPPTTPPNEELLAAAESLEGRFTFESLLSKLLSQRREAEMAGIEVAQAVAGLSMAPPEATPGL